jgi:predicted Rossmann fold flavoprotein
MEALGHRVTPLAPALVPLVVETPWVRALSGISAWVRVQVVDARGATLLDRVRPILFTHFGLSGPAAMDASRFFALAPPWARPRLFLDFAPQSSPETVRAALDREIAETPSGAIERCLPASLPERLRRSIAGAAGEDPAKRATEVSKASRHALVQGLKRLEVVVAGTLGWDHAEVTAGGVDLGEVDPGTMESRIVPGLFLAGEILDLDGPIGGFNFQSAFATGELAGRNA